MTDALAYRYEPDREIVEVEEPTVSRPRISTEDLIVYVMTEDGYRHRLDAGMTETACGYPIDLRVCTPVTARVIEHPLANRRPDGALCDCWTTREREKAGDAYRKKFGTDFKYPPIKED